MSKPKVFISHCSKTQETKAFLEAVYSALTQHGNGESFEVFLDREEISAGEEWHQKILKNLCTCDAVVLLLSAAALESHWVRQEAAFSAMRRYGDPFLKLIVIPVGDNVSVDRIKECPYLGDVARLHDVQFAPNNKMPDEIIEELAQLTVGSYSPIGELLLNMSETLEYIKPDTLKRAIQTLEHNGVAKLNWNTFLANTLALSIASEQHKALQNLSILLEEIGHVVKYDNAVILLNMIEHLWVKFDASENLAKAQQNRVPTTIGGYNPDDFTARGYAKRAWGKRKYCLVPVDGCRSFSEIKEVIRRKAAKWIKSKRRADEHLKKTKTLILLIFPAPDEDSFNVDFLPDENLLKDIMGEYKTAAVFIPTGETQPDYRPDLQPLKPLLDVDVEETQYKAYLDVIKYIQENLSIGNNYE